MIFTCSSTTGQLDWQYGDHNAGYFNPDISLLNSSRSLDIFTVLLNSISGNNLSSTATVQNISNSQTGTIIECSVDGAMNYNEITINVRS